MAACSSHMPPTPLLYLSYVCLGGAFSAHRWQGNPGKAVPNAADEALKLLLLGDVVHLTHNVLLHAIRGLAACLVLWWHHHPSVRAYEHTTTPVHTQQHTATRTHTATHRNTPQPQSTKTVACGVTPADDAHRRRSTKLCCVTNCTTAPLLPATARNPSTTAVHTL